MQGYGPRWGRGRGNLRRARLDSAALAELELDGKPLTYRRDRVIPVRGPHRSELGDGVGGAAQINGGCRK